MPSDPPHPPRGPENEQQKTTQEGEEPGSNEQEPNGGESADMPSNNSNHYSGQRCIRAYVTVLSHADNLPMVPTYVLDGPNSDAAAFEIEAWITEEGNVNELKASLESQDALPDATEGFKIEVFFSDMSSTTPEPLGEPSEEPSVLIKVQDHHVIPEHVKRVYIYVRPIAPPHIIAPPHHVITTARPAVAIGPGPSGGSHIGNAVRGSADTARPTSSTEAEQRRRMAEPVVSTPNLIQTLLQSQPLFGWGPRQQDATPSWDFPFNLTAASNQPSSSSSSSQNETNTNWSPDQLTHALMTDSEMVRHVMASPMMRSLMENPDVLRAVIDANPQMRELRERHPELNQLLNDPELLQQSMQAMQNPSLMREMISNTDRVLNNIDAIPGGFNALRRVYHSIQEPMWDVAFSQPDSHAKSGPPRSYDLQRDKKPSTQAIPNPWANPSPTRPTPRHPSFFSTSNRNSSNIFAAMPSPSLLFQSPTQSSAHVIPSPRNVSDAEPHPVNPATSRPSTTIASPPTEATTANSLSSTSPAPRSEGSFPATSLVAALSAPTNPTTASESSRTSPPTRSDARLQDPFTRTILPAATNMSVTSAHVYGGPTSLQPRDLSDTLHDSAPTEGSTEPIPQGVAVSSTQTPSTDNNHDDNKNNTTHLDTCLNASRVADSKEPPLIESKQIDSTMSRNTLSSHQDEKHPGDLSVSDATVHLEEGTSQPTGETPSSNHVTFQRSNPAPFLYSSLFPNQNGLRSLGGLSLPHSPHIRGVLRPSHSGTSNVSNVSQASSSSNNDTRNSDVDKQVGSSAEEDKQNKNV